MSKPKKGAALGRPVDPRAFTALDAVMQARTDFEGTFGILQTMLDGDLDETALLTVERHLKADWAALQRATDNAWDALVRRGGAK